MLPKQRLKKPNNYYAKKKAPVGCFFLCFNNIRIVELSHNITVCKIFCGSSQRFAEACGKKTAPRKICAGLLMQSVIRQRGNIAHAGENMLRTIGETLDFLRVGDAEK